MIVAECVSARSKFVVETGYVLPSEMEHGDEREPVDGFCPVHDPDKEDEGSATFLLFKNSWKCNGDPSCHHPKKGCTIDDLHGYMLLTGML